LAASLAESEDRFFMPPCSTLSLSKLSGIPNGLELVYDVRLLPSQSVDEVEKEFHQNLQEISKSCPNMNIVGTKEHLNLALAQPADHPLGVAVRKVLNEIGLSPEQGALSVDSAASLFVNAGFPSVVFGAGEEEQLHQPNESVGVECIEKTFRFYERLIERLCT
jgi:acetylornithine deacetylase/succinyl-diaminopimelate desuccinylase-like protein